MELNGAGKIVYTVDENASVILNPTLGGIGIIQGETMRGEVGVPVFISSWPQFLREFGGYHPDSNFPKYMKVMLEAGAKFWVARTFHYTDVTDKSTVEGTKSTATVVETTNSIVFDAVAVGPGYDGIKVEIIAAVSGEANKFDILVTGQNDIEETVTDVSQNPDAAEITSINQKLKTVDLISVTGNMAIGSAILAGGVQVIADIVANDYNGDASQMTGLYQFSKAKNAFRLVNVKADPDIDVFYSNFARDTMSVKAEVGVPIGATYQGIDDYRLGNGAYVHTAINHWLTTFTYGDMAIPDPEDSAKTINIPGVVAAIGNKLVKDAGGAPWLSAATLPEFGVIKSANRGVNYDLNSPENIAQYDLLSKSAGANVITNDEQFGAVYHGNDSAMTVRNTILQHENVADLILYILKNLPQYVKTSQWRPNDPQMWEQLYLNVRPFITTTLVGGRAIRPRENSDWFWIGDQGVDDYKDAVYNKLADIDAGKYKARFVFIPIPATKFIGIDFVPTDSNSIAAIVRDDLN